jgi:hypothetical protein
MTSEGLWTTFRELKPGTMDAIFDGFAPLRFCLFAEPVVAARKTPIKLEAVLANEDALAPGKYPARLLVVDPNGRKVFDKTIDVVIPAKEAGKEPPMVMAVFAADVPIDGPSGKYRFLATFERGAAAAGGQAEFYLLDPAEMPPVETEVALLGEDPGLAKWLADRGIRTKAFGKSDARRAILVSGPVADDAAFAELTRQIAAGSTAVFLTPAALAVKDQPTARLPIAKKGTIVGLPSWLYHKDEWCKRHPIFDGLPSGGLMDYTFYRDLIPDNGFVGQEPVGEVVAGANNASQAYSSGTLLVVHTVGEGRAIVNTLRIRENLGPNPVAERLLRNLLRFAAGTAK